MKPGPGCIILSSEGSEIILPEQSPANIRLDPG